MIDQEGFRTDIELELVDLTQDGLRVTGTWNTKTGINVSATPKPEIVPSGKDSDLRNMSFVVITALVSDTFYTCTLRCFSKNTSVVYLS